MARQSFDGVGASRSGSNTYQLRSRRIDTLGALGYTNPVKEARAKVFLVSLMFAVAQVIFADPLDRWHLRTSETASNLYSVAYGSDRFVAVGQGGIILVSTNGINWNSSSNSISVELRGVAWGQGLFVTVGNSGTILTSPDAIAWTQQSSPATDSVNAVRFLNDEFIVVGDGGVLLASTNGSDWISRDSSTTLPLTAVAFGNGVFVAVGRGSTHNIPITRSLDGISWSNQIFPFLPQFDITFGNGFFVSQGIRGEVFVSTNGVNWLLGSTGTGYVYGSTFARGRFLGVGESKKIVTSVYGTNWMKRPVATGFNSSLRAAAYGNHSFVAVGDGGIILQSDPLLGLAVGETLPDGSLQWLLKGESNRSYHFQYSENLSISNWADVTNFISTDETTVLTDPTAGNSDARYYRVISP